MRNLPGVRFCYEKKTDGGSVDFLVSSLSQRREQAAGGAIGNGWEARASAATVRSAFFVDGVGGRRFFVASHRGLHDAGDGGFFDPAGEPVEFRD